MHAHVEWKCEHAGVMRLYEDGCNFQNRDPYMAAVFVFRKGEDTVELSGWTTKSTGDIYRTFRKALVAEGFDWVEWDRSQARHKRHKLRT